MNDLLRLARIQIATIVLFVINKMLVRPYVLERDFSEPFRVFVFSFPNLCEAIVGTLTLTYIGLFINYRRIQPSRRIRDSYLYLLATLIAAVYVVLQELKIHNLGGENVYDPFDVVFSLIGLVIAHGILILIKPTVRD